MDNIFQVVVSNIGIIYNGDNFVEASAQYARYIMRSKQEVGRGAGETVTLFHNDQITAEFLGKQEAA